MSKRLLPLIPGGLVVDQVQPGSDRIAVIARSRHSSSPCPHCRTCSSRIHSRYERHLADLPWQGRPVDIHIRARRFLCLRPGCPRRTFAERLPGVVRPSARRSERLADIQRSVALALGGEAGMRLAARLAMPVSADTLLRSARSFDQREPPPPRVIGVDEWAWRKGRRYGTILVDLERNAVVDLLPDRDAGTFATWLRDHPGVEVIARDRADVYADGARRGAPNAVQVADRWHLLRNLGDAVRAVVGRHHAAIRRAGHGITLARTVPTSSDARMPTAREARKAARHAPRRARYAEVRRLKDAGASISAIARACALDRKTVRKWLCEGGPGTWVRSPEGAGSLAPHIGYLERRWSEGLRSGTKLWHELVGRGFTGGRTAVRAWTTRRRRTHPDMLDPRTAVPGGWTPPTINRLARLLQAAPESLAALDRAFVDRVLAEAPALAQIRDLARRFATLVRKEGSDTLDGWLAAATGSPLAKFAAGLGRDLAAVRAALEMPWSTSPVEGQISRLKMIKRTMYGRAGFALLRSRVLKTA